MSNNKRTLFLAIGGAALMWAAFNFFGPSKETPQESPAAGDLPLPPVNSGSQSTLFNVTAPTPQPTPSPEGPLPRLGPHLRTIGDCLQIKNSLNEEAPLNILALQDSLRGELGDLVANQIEWKNVHFTLSNGEKRRLRIEVEAQGEEGSVQRLQYFGVDSEDLPIPIPLTDEQSKNPTEEYIISIENQGTVTLREEAHNALFSNGAEIAYVERNGSLSEIELTYNGKSVKCQSLQGDQANCTCF